MVGKFDHNDYNLSSLGLSEGFIHFFCLGGQPINDGPSQKKKKKVLLPPMVEDYIHSSVIKHD
jgi:hypothetical protein